MKAKTKKLAAKIRELQGGVKIEEQIENVIRYTKESKVGEKEEMENTIKVLKKMKEEVKGRKEELE